MRHYPTLEMCLPTARLTWPSQAKDFVGDGWLIAETRTDRALARFIDALTIDEVRRFYASEADKLNEQYGNGKILYRSHSIEQSELIGLVDRYHRTA